MILRVLFLLISLLGISATGSAQAIASHPDEIVAILGDSNTSIGGDDCASPRAWTYEWVRAYAPASVHSYARSGATWSNVAATKRNTVQKTGILADDNTIYNQVERLAEAIDRGSQDIPTLILIMAGTNDAWFSPKRPGAFSMTPSDAMAMGSDEEIAALAPGRLTSIPLAIRNNVVRLQAIAPDADIVLLSPLQSVQAPDSLIARIGDIVEEMGAQLACPAIRLDRDFEINSAAEAKEKVLTYDGTHTSQEGARRLGQFLARRISALDPQ